MSNRHIVIPEQSNLPHRLGRHVEHDEQSRAFRATAGVIPPPRSVLHRRWGPLLDQDGAGACTYFGVLNALHHVPLYRRGERHTNDEGFEGYGRATEIDEFDGTWRSTSPHGEDTGSSGLAAAKVAKEKGLISRYEWNFSLEETLAAVNSNVVLIGSGWTESMFDVPPSGVIEVTGADIGGHEYAITGSDVRRRLVRIHCAWRLWGVNGQQWAWMRWDDLGGRLEDYGDSLVLRR